MQVTSHQCRMGRRWALPTTSCPDTTVPSYRSSTLFGLEKIGWVDRWLPQVICPAVGRVPLSSLLV
jgi:hypothetical protein